MDVISKKTKTRLDFWIRGRLFTTSKHSTIEQTFAKLLQFFSNLQQIKMRLRVFDWNSLPSKVLNIDKFLPFTESSYGNKRIRIIRFLLIINYSYLLNFFYILYVCMYLLFYYYNQYYLLFFTYTRYPS